MIDPMLCWFCGLNRDPSKSIRGRSIGGMVYSADTYVSDGELEIISDSSWEHIRHDAAEICSRCSQLFTEKAAAQPPEYFANMQRAEDAAFEEMLDFETELLSLGEREYFFDCWFGHAAAIESTRHFPGICFGELFELGFRLKGHVRLDSEAFDRFLARMPAIDMSVAPARQESISHFQSHLEGIDTKQARRFCAVIPVILDFSAVMLSRGSKSLPRQFPAGG